MLELWSKFRAADGELQMDDPVPYGNVHDTFPSNYSPSVLDDIGWAMWPPKTYAQIGRTA
jgi:hypothetical protein